MSVDIDYFFSKACREDATVIAKQLHAVVFGWIMTGGNLNAASALVMSHQDAGCWSCCYVSIEYVATKAYQAIHNGIGKHATGSSSIASHHDLSCGERCCIGSSVAHSNFRGQALANDSAQPRYTDNRFVQAFILSGNPIPIDVSYPVGTEVLSDPLVAIRTCRDKWILVRNLKQKWCLSLDFVLIVHPRDPWHMAVMVDNHPLPMVLRVDW